MEEKANPFSEWPREKLEEQVIKGLKHIKALRKQNTDLMEAAQKLENRLNEQIQITGELADENERLQNSHKQTGFAIGNIGKTLTSMIKGSHHDLILEQDKETITIEAVKCDESPEVISLRAFVKQAQMQASESQQNEKTIREFAESLQKKMEQREVVLTEATSKCEAQRRENGKLQLELEEARRTGAELKAKIERLEAALAEAQSLAAPAFELASANTNLEKLAAKHSELVEQHELLKNETIEARVAREETERKNEQLKESLKKAVRANKDKDDEIHALKQRLIDVKDERGEIGQQFDGLRELVSVREREISEMKAQITELTDRLNTGRGSVAVEAKVSQMQRMIEKSNELYADMQERAAKDAARVRELEVQLHSAKSPGNPLFNVETSSGEFVLCENGRWFRGHSSAASLTLNTGSHSDKDTQTETTTNNNEYLKTLIVKFFRANSKAQRELMPVILDVLGVSAAEKHSLVYKPRGPFSFFQS